MCHTPMLLGALMPPEPSFQRVDNKKKLGKKCRMCDQFHISAAELARWWRPVASGAAPNSLHQAMRLDAAWVASGSATMVAVFSGVFVCCGCFCIASSSPHVKKWYKIALRIRLTALLFDLRMRAPHHMLSLHHYFCPPISTTLCAHAHYEKWLAWPCLWIRPPWLF